MKQYVWASIGCLIFVVGLLIGIDIGNDECNDCYTCTLPESQTIYINQSDNCLNEVLNTLDEADEIKREVFRKVNYK